MPDPEPNLPDDDQFRVPTEFFLAMSHHIRVWMAQQLAEGGTLTATQVARHWKLNVDSANHHCKMLLKGHVVSARRGEDRRSTVYFIAEPIRRLPGLLDYGWCHFRIR
ncbi:MAG: helix-turn-helix transcriptional regulator [Chthoniobacteraceae bacterium]